MDDKALAMMLTAMSDQTAALNRMADAMMGILVHMDPKAASKVAAPGYQRPLEAYASFDWNSIDAHVIAFDRHGATEVEHNGVAYRRYRSNDDDPKGVDIRFRRVYSGTPEGKDMIWVTLIKFADPRKKDPPRPLRGELAEKIEHAQSGGSAVAVVRSATRPALVTPDSSPVTGNSSLTSNNSSLTTNDSPPAEPVVENPTTSPLTAEQIKAELNTRFRAKAASMRPIDDLTRSRAYLALRTACGGDDGLHRVVLYLFGRGAYKALSSTEAWTVQLWLKPTQDAERHWVASNAMAVAEIETLLKHLSTPIPDRVEHLEAVPA